MQKLAAVVGSIVLSVGVLVVNGFADQGGHGAGETHGGGTHMKVSGVVSKIQSDLITVKTPWGETSDCLLHGAQESRSR